MMLFALHESASLIGRLWSSAFRLSTTAASASLAGSCFYIHSLAHESPGSPNNHRRYALDAVPPGVDPAAVRSYLSNLPGVSAVRPYHPDGLELARSGREYLHDLHIWAMSTTETALTVHLVRVDGRTDDAFLTEAAHELDHRFGIHHSTMQVETGEQECRLAPANVV